MPHATLPSLCYAILRRSVAPQDLTLPLRYFARHYGAPPLPCPAMQYAAIQCHCCTKPNPTRRCHAIAKPSRAGHHVAIALLRDTKLHPTLPLHRSTSLCQAIAIPCYTLLHRTSPCFALPLPCRAVRDGASPLLYGARRHKAVRHIAIASLNVTLLDSAFTELGPTGHYSAIAVRHRAMRDITAPSLCYAILRRSVAIRCEISQSRTPRCHCCAMLHAARPYVALPLLSCVGRHDALPLPHIALPNSAMPSLRYSLLCIAMLSKTMQCTTTQCHCDTLLDATVPRHCQTLPYDTTQRHCCAIPCHALPGTAFALLCVDLLCNTLPLQCYAILYFAIAKLHSTLLYNAIAMPRLASLHAAMPLRYCAKHCGTPRCSALPLPYSALPRLAIADLCPTWPCHRCVFFLTLLMNEFRGFSVLRELPAEAGLTYSPRAYGFGCVPPYRMESLRQQTQTLMQKNTKAIRSESPRSSRAYEKRHGHRRGSSERR